MLDTIKSTLVPVHPEGHKFMALFGVVTLVAFWLLPDFFGWIGVILVLWCGYFFRDPPRVTPIDDNLVVAPADGRISLIETVDCPPELDLDGEQRTRVSIFMNVFDVHINRAPVNGKISRLTYIAGKFLNAELDKASEDNERQALTLVMPDDRKIGVVQIAGLVARRIVKFVHEGDHLQAGQRFGLIRFGSRVDVYLPQGVVPLVAVDQRTIAGETVLARLDSDQAAIDGRKS